MKTSSEWIVRFPPGYVGPDNRVWVGFIRCHNCPSFQVVREEKGGRRFYSACDNRRLGIALDGCGADYGWPRGVILPNTTLADVQSHEDFAGLPEQLREMIINAWGNHESETTPDQHHGDAGAGATARGLRPAGTEPSGAGPGSRDPGDEWGEYQRLYG